MTHRKHLTPREVEKLIAEAGKSRYAERNVCLLTLAYLHGLRISEALNLKLQDVDLEDATLYVSRLKGSLSTNHPIKPSESLVIERWLESRGTPPVDWLFVSERGTRPHRSVVWRQIRAWGEQAGILIPVHPHMLRHACGYALANRGADTRLIQDYLGHRNIQCTVRYTATNSERFKSLWD